MKRACSWEIIRESSRGLTLAKSPIADAEFFLSKCESIVGMRSEFVACRECDGSGSVKHAIDLAEKLPDDFVARAGFREFASEFVKGGGSFFAAALGFTLSTNACDELAENDSNDEISAK